ncbi:hypothetical protein DL93DRAFT_2165972 [Clavulina sp. PMI_390]|nr:hypothetical protein DL93DRAFT_2165972 [Clavulina sp. PMI_390]
MSYTTRAATSLPAPATGRPRTFAHPRVLANAADSTSSSPSRRVGVRPIDLGESTTATTSSSPVPMTLRAEISNADSDVQMGPGSVFRFQAYLQECERACQGPPVFPKGPFREKEVTQSETPMNSVESRRLEVPAEAIPVRAVDLITFTPNPRAEAGIPTPIRSTATYLPCAPTNPAFTSLSTPDSCINDAKRSPCVLGPLQRHKSSRPFSPTNHRNQVVASPPSYDIERQHMDYFSCPLGSGNDGRRPGGSMLDDASLSTLEIEPTGQDSTFNMLHHVSKSGSANPYDIHPLCLIPAGNRNPIKGAAQHRQRYGYDSSDSEESHAQYVEERLDMDLRMEKDIMFEHSLGELTTHGGDTQPLLKPESHYPRYAPPSLLEPFESCTGTEARRYSGWVPRNSLASDSDLGATPLKIENPFASPNPCFASPDPSAPIFNWAQVLDLDAYENEYEAEDEADFRGGRSAERRGWEETPKPPAGLTTLPLTAQDVLRLAHSPIIFQNRESIPPSSSHSSASSDYSHQNYASSSSSYSSLSLQEFSQFKRTITPILPTLDAVDLAYAHTSPSFRTELLAKAAWKTKKMRNEKVMRAHRARIERGCKRWKIWKEMEARQGVERGDGRGDGQNKLEAKKNILWRQKREWEIQQAEKEGIGLESWLLRKEIEKWNRE